MGKEEMLFLEAQKNLQKIDNLILELRKLADESYLIARLKQINQKW